MLVPLHGVGTRHDLPLPFSLVVAAAAVVLLVTFVGVVKLWRTPQWEHPRGVPLPGLTRLVDHPATTWVGRILVAAIAALGMLALWFGADRVSNPWPGMLFVWVWVGLVPISLLTGRSWQRFSLVRLLLWWRGGLKETEPLPRWGLWPGAAALAAFGFLELVQPDRTALAVLRIWFVIWLVWVVGGALVFGARWIASADPFEVFATLVSRLSPWQRIDGVVHLVNPLRQVSSTVAASGTWVLGSVLLGTTAFDALGSSTWWVQTVQSSTAPRILLGVAGLAGMIAFLGGMFWLGFRTIRLPQGPNSGTVSETNRLGLSLVPIAVGYVIAHYASYFILEGQRVVINLSDPLSKGQDWFGTATLGVNGSIFDHPTLMAWTQALWIVLGHVVGVLVAHDLAIRWLPARHRLWGQVPMLAVMVLFTCGGLLLLFAG